MSQKKWLTEFIEIYKNELCLWKNKSKEYLDQEMELAAYKYLLENMK